MLVSTQNQPKSWSYNCITGNLYTPAISLNCDNASRSFDQDGRMTSHEFASYTYDAASRITGITQSLSNSATISSAPSRTLSNVITNVAYTLDANGNLTSDGLRTFQYGADNRLAEVDVSDNGEAAKITYLHNAIGQRTFKSEPQTAQTLPNQTALGDTFIDWLKKNFGWLYATAQSNATIGTAYSYADPSTSSGQALPSWALLGEYGNGGASSSGRVEYIWLPTDDGNAIPVAMFRSNRYYSIHSDHLGTPRLIKDDEAKPVWQWSYSAFGDNKPTGILKATTNPNSAVTNTPALLAASSPAFAFNLRFPGQYADSETGLFYNYFRSYQATQGRYTQGDPIGLAGGMNRFGYVEGNPLSLTDPRGLDALCGPGKRAISTGQSNVYTCVEDGSDPNAKTCVTAECAAGVLPTKPASPAACFTACFAIKTGAAYC